MAATRAATGRLVSAPTSHPRRNSVRRLGQVERVNQRLGLRVGQGDDFLDVVHAFLHGVRSM